MQKSHNNLNILISCGSYSWGGLEMISLETALKLAEKNNNVKILCSIGSKLGAVSEASGINIVPIFSKDKNLLSSIGRLKEYLKHNPTDVIHSNHSHDLWTLTPAINRSGLDVKLFLTKHMDSGIKKKDIFHKFLYKRVNGIFAISNYIKQSVLDTCPVPETKVHLLPVGIDIKKFSMNNFNKALIRREFNLPENKLIIGIAGRMTPGKGHEEFLEAAKVINEKYAAKVLFIVIGSASYGEDEYEAKIKKYAEELNLSNILFTGHTADIPKMLALLDILAFPSHNESFGRVLLEAMALELPVAASGNAGVVDIVVSNETGLLFEPKNSASLCEALIQLIENPQLREKLGKAGKKRAEEVFDFGIMTKKLMEYYTE